MSYQTILNTQQLVAQHNARIVELNLGVLDLVPADSKLMPHAPRGYYFTTKIILGVARPAVLVKR